MKKKELKTVLNKKINEKALQYLNEMRGSKGKEISYTRLQMRNYLLPNKFGLSITDKHILFSIQNRMINIFENVPSKKLPKYCPQRCNVIDKNEHLYQCEKLNMKTPTASYIQIFEENSYIQTKIFNTFKENMKRRGLIE